jgi:hypothetical protein
MKDITGITLISVFFSIKAGGTYSYHCDLFGKCAHFVPLVAIT